MTVEKGRLFSIGQFAALHGVNKKTLMWYDEIGLFCRRFVKENGYRYYTYFQSATLEAILLLRELDVPVARIRSFLDDRSAQSLAALWDEQLDAVDRKLARLRELRRTMQAQANETKALLELDTGSIEIVTCPPERLMLLPTTREAGWEQDIRTLGFRAPQPKARKPLQRGLRRDAACSEPFGWRLSGLPVCLPAPSGIRRETRRTRKTGRQISARVLPGKCQPRIRALSGAACVRARAGAFFYGLCLRDSAARDGSGNFRCVHHAY